jgi:hypothetical protein
VPASYISEGPKIVLQAGLVWISFARPKKSNRNLLPVKQSFRASGQAQPGMNHSVPQKGILGATRLEQPLPSGNRIIGLIGPFL